MADPFERYRRMRGKLSITVRDAQYELAATLDDKKEFVRVRSEIDKGKLPIESLYDYALKLMKKSYPQEDAQLLEDFIVANSSEFFDELMLAYGLVTKKRLDDFYAGAAAKKD